MKVHIEATERQAKLMMFALDLVSRIGTGQLKEIDNALSTMDINGAEGTDEEKKVVMSQLKKLYFPDLDEGASYGIFSRHVPDESKVSWDMIQSIRHAMAWHQNPEGGYKVNFDTPIPSTNTEPLLQVRITEE